MIKNLFKTREGKFYTLHDLKKNNARLVYWLYFPQGITGYKHGTTWSSHHIDSVKTFNVAKKLARKYHPALIMRMIESDLGRWCLKEFYTSPEDAGLSDDELWNKYSKYPPVEIGLKNNPLVVEN